MVVRFKGDGILGVVYEEEGSVKGSDIDVTMIADAMCLTRTQCNK